MVDLRWMGCVMWSDALISQLVFGDAHELSGGSGSLQAGDGGEFVVVDLGGVKC